MYHQYCVQIFM